MFENEVDTETEGQYSNHYSSCNESDTDFLQSDCSDSMEEGKEQNAKRIAQFLLYSGNH